jgi:hypothetical protein
MLLLGKQAFKFEVPLCSSPVKDFSTSLHIDRLTTKKVVFPIEKLFRKLPFAKPKMYDLVLKTH